MRAIILIQSAAVVGLGVLASQQVATIEGQRVGLSAAKEQIKASSLAQQERCSNEARKWFVQQHYGVNDLASYENHYNVKLDKCVIAVKNTVFDKDVAIGFKHIVNVFENSPVGTYVNQSGQITHAT